MAGGKMVICFIILSFCFCFSESSECKPDSLPVQDNFDAKKFFDGKWYKTEWKSSNFTKDDLDNFQAEYKIDSKGNITFENSGRNKSGDCEYYTGELTKTSTEGKLLYFKYEGGRVPYWVMKTDYVNYGIVYGCYEKAENGTCNQWYSMIFSRTKTMSDSINNTVNDYIRSNECLKADLFVSVKQDNACPTKGGAGVKDVSKNLVLVCLAAMFMFFK